uniref:Putative secreted protein n=1 Tax=Rhipicephalus microplus TaxID=6941 RepID=A0A6M2DBN1_RHIMP
MYVWFVRGGPSVDGLRLSLCLLVVRVCCRAVTYVDHESQTRPIVHPDNSVTLLQMNVCDCIFCITHKSK